MKNVEIRGSRRHGRLVAAAVIAVASAIMVASCYWAPRSAGGSIQFSFSAPSRSITSNVSLTGTATVARLYLYTATGAVTFSDGKSYQEVTGISTTSGTTVTFDAIPAGPSYSLYLVLGEKAGSGGTFVPESYVESTAPFQLVAGGTTELSGSSISAITPVPINAVQFVGNNVPSVANLSGNVYALVGSTSLYQGANLPGMRSTGALPSVPGGGTYSASSISIGLDSTMSPEIWLNTNHGILPFNGTFDNQFATGDIVTAADTPPANTVGVLDSGAVPTAVILTDRAIFYQSSGGLGGTIVTLAEAATPGDWQWVDVDLTGAHIAGKPVTSFAFVGSDIFFATKLGSFSTDDTLFANTSLDFGTLLNSVHFFSVESGGTTYPVVALGSDGTNIYMATQNGVYIATAATIKANDTITGTPVAGTKYQNVTRIVVSSTNYRAYLSDNYIFVNHGTTGATPVKLPLPIASLGTPNQISVDDSGVLYVAGSKGLVSIDLTTILP